VSVSTPTLASLAALPDTALVPVAWVRDILDALDAPATASPVSAEEPKSWRERLWSVPAETRLGVAEVAEALGRPKSYVYARTGPKADDPLPHRKLEGSVVITAGELRAWLRDREVVVHAGPYLSVAAGGAA
jgi:hypothetical protein